jgi:hypothetical protein
MGYGDGGENTLVLVELDDVPAVLVGSDFP